MKSYNCESNSITIKPSRGFLFALIMLFVSLAGCVFVMKLTLLIKVASLFLLMGYFVYLFRIHGWIPRQLTLFRLEWDKPAWRLISSNKTESLTELWATKLTFFAIFLCVKSNSGKRTHLVIWRDSIAETEFKSLYVALKFRQFEARKEP